LLNWHLGWGRGVAELAVELGGGQELGILSAIPDVLPLQGNGRATREHMMQEPFQELSEKWNVSVLV